MSTRDDIERELKFGPVDLGELRERLEELEAERQGAPDFEDNWIFDKDDALMGVGSLLRLRKVERGGSKLTYKGPAVFEEGVKVRTEHETDVGSFDGTCSVLRALGYARVRRYQKYREEWQLGSVTIALDHTPIGDFVEFEGDDCLRVAKRCGLESERAEKRNYLDLYEDYLGDHPDAPPDMVFP